MPTRIDERLERVVGQRLGRWSPTAVKLIKYGTASAAGIVTSQTVLLLCLVVLDVEPVPANIVAVCVGAVPNYLINRAWTFNKRGRHSLRREIAPFWAMSLAGLVLSTVAVAWVSGRTDHPLALSATSIGAFGVLWVGRYLILDRFLFAPEPEGDERGA